MTCLQTKVYSVAGDNPKMLMYFDMALGLHAATSMAARQHCSSAAYTDVKPSLAPAQNEHT